jgi:hypothetical protein
MAESKYEKLVVKNPYRKVFDTESVSLHDNELNCGVLVAFQPVVKPFLMPPKSHNHEYPQVLLFLGTNPYNVREFDAEIELTVGKEETAEVITFNCPSAITIPAGVYHCPLNFKRVGKPFIFMEIDVTGEYSRTYVDGTPGVAYDQELRGIKPRPRTDTDKK